MSKQFGEVHKELLEKFDFVIFDSPPVGLVTDAVLIMQNTDLQFYIMKSEFSKRSFTKVVNDLIHVSGFSKLTVIFNGLKASRGGYGYGNYGYGYGNYGYGNYGYGYYEERTESKKRRSLSSIISGLF